MIIKTRVYKLTCGTHHKVYISQTRKPFTKCVWRQKHSFMKEKNDSKYQNIFNLEIQDLNKNLEKLHSNCLESLGKNRLRILLSDQSYLNGSPLLNILAYFSFLIVTLFNGSLTTL